MPTSVGPNTFGEENLVFGYDLGDVANSYKGQPTVNLAAAGGLIGMSGITLTDLGVEDGWRKYSMSGTFTGGTYPYIMHISSYTFTGGIIYSSRCTVKTNVEYKFNYFGANGLSYVNQPMSNGGSLSSIQNSDGSYTIARIGFAYTNTTSQPGYLWTNPINNTTFNSATDFVWIKELQVEQKPFPTQFVNGTRSATQGLIDLTGNSTIDLSNVSFDSNAQMTFDGTDDIIQIPSAPWNILQTFTLEAVFNPTGNVGAGYHVMFQKEGGFSGGAVYGLRASNQGSGNILAMICYDAQSINAFTLDSTTPTVNGQTYHVVSTFDSSYNWKIYVNGVLQNSTTLTNLPFQNTSSISVGRGDGRTMNGYLPISKIYNRVLTAQEIRSNFNAIKGRFNI